MAKIRLTKNELKKQKDALKRYKQYLPTLILKKQQLQAEILKLHQSMEEVKKERAYEKAATYKWVDVFAEEAGIEHLVSMERIETSEGNIAGIDIPIFEKIEFAEEEYDLIKTPLWVDEGIEAVKRIMTLNARMEILKKQEELVREELRRTSQRVNLFEKVMIPETAEHIRRIGIYLGDMQTAGVVTGKIAKSKLAKKALKEIEV